MSPDTDVLGSMTHLQKQGRPATRGTCWFLHPPWQTSPGRDATRHIAGSDFQQIYLNIATPAFSGNSIPDVTGRARPR